MAAAAKGALMRLVWQQLLLLLLLLLLLQESVFPAGAAAWPLYHMTPHTVWAGESVLMEYRGDVAANGSVELFLPAVWTVASGPCAVESSAPGNGTASLRCAGSGTAQLLLQRGALNDSLPVASLPSRSCYQWDVEVEEKDSNRTVAAGEALQPHALYRLQVRVKAATAEESRVRSAQFRRAGEQVSVQPDVHARVIAEGRATWDDDRSAWLQTVRTNGPEEGSLLVQSLGIGVLGCSVRPVAVALAVATFDLSSAAFPAVAVSGLAAPVSGLRVATDSCSPNAVVLVRDQDAFLTQGGLATHPEVLVALPGPVAAALVTSTTVLLLRPNGTLAFLEAGNETAGFRSPAGLPALPGLTAISRARPCDRLLDPAGGPDAAAGWIAVWNDSAAWQSLDYGRSFEAMGLPAARPVRDVTLVPGAGLVVLAASVLHVLDERSSGTGSVWVPGEAISDPGVGSVAQPPTGSGELVMFGGASVLYSPDAGQTVLPVTLSPALEAGEELARLEFDPRGSGAYLALSSFGRAFYGRVGLLQAVAVDAGDAGGPDATPAFVRPSVPVVLRLADRYELPLTNALTALSATQVCPYAGWDRPDPASLDVYLDMGESASLRSTLYETAASSNALAASLSGSSRAGLSVGLSVSVTSGSLVRRAVEVNVSEGPYDDDSWATQSRTERLRRGQGSAAVRIAPVRDSLSCDVGLVAGERARPPAVASVRVGCPPLRHVRVRDASVAGCGQLRFSEVTQRGLPDTVYSHEVFGCAVRIYQQTTQGYRPTLDLYDGDVRVGEVDAGFVVWELQGRTDYGLNTSLGDAGCTSRPMSWEEAELLGVDWTPETHRPCTGVTWPPAGLDLAAVPADQRFRYEFHRSDTYEVLSTVTLNAIRFKASGKDGMFLFRARVVDPTYSYCELEAYFALDAFGAPLTLAEIFLVTGLATTTVLLALAASYFYYRNKLSMKKVQ